MKLLVLLKFLSEKWVFQKKPSEDPKSGSGIMYLECNMMPDSDIRNNIPVLRTCAV